MKSSITYSKSFRSWGLHASNCGCDECELERRSEEAGLKRQELREAWNELQAVPSYVEQQARAFASEE